MMLTPLESALCFFFFFQAEDGIRDDLVTGVQTCALPISACVEPRDRRHGLLDACRNPVAQLHGVTVGYNLRRSEERRVGKECRSRWSPDDYKKNERIEE